MTSLSDPIGTMTTLLKLLAQLPDEVLRDEGQLGA
jgi:hypothetical protein